MKVLVVTTNPAVSLQITTALIDETGAQILEVRTPQRAIRELDAGSTFDLVLADADTAPTGGFALARDVKARVRMGQAMPPVVLLIARDQDKFLAKWSEADAFILKPADPFDLNAVVRAVVAGEEVPSLPGVGVTRDLPQVLGVPEGQSATSVAAAGN